MDVFSRTFLPATGEAGIPMATVSRHMPIFRRCVEAGDATVLVARALRPERPLGREFLLLLTYRRLVITQESRILRRLRLHLNTDLRHLANVTWHPDPRLSAIEFAATAVDGIRERFWIHAGHPKQVWHLDALFSHVFKPKLVAQRTAGLNHTPYTSFADHLVGA
ncbi:hypothetical protein CS0771_11550 [Catellatospora sp. IY07-71]|uniref:hypothetical protein n=1 Tax=Catellatospora sp. IY07-71 TaxID=2728827 RepID=UPI001BB4B966|nr:hypothetical protein [Catellatospora sp. IY07-71]BCJ71611.1 hypothetical protein CS0771_11550 [Catellatospora sp. IY07-71]